MTVEEIVDKSKLQQGIELLRLFLRMLQRYTQLLLRTLDRVNSEFDIIEEGIGVLRLSINRPLD